MPNHTHTNFSNELTNFTRHELELFELMGVKVGDHLIHRGELCKVRTINPLAFDFFSDVSMETQVRWMADIGVNVRKKR